MPDTTDTNRTAASSTHPDHAFLDGVRVAVEWWAGRVTTRPTSSIAGTGAVADVERAAAAYLGVEHVLALPSASSALLVALQVLGVGPGDEVLVPALDWTAGAGAVRMLGARPVPVLPVEGSVVLDPAEAARCRTARTRAVLATHLLGVAVDVPALRTALPDLPVLEDCAQAWGASLDGCALGTFGDLAVFAGKGLDLDGIGFLVAAEHSRWARAVRLSQHPVRQWHDGCEVTSDVWCQRVAPLSALVAAHRLSGCAARDVVARSGEPELAALVGALPVRPLLDARRGGVPGRIPVLAESLDVAWLKALEAAGVGFRRCGALSSTDLPDHRREALAGLVSRAGVLVAPSLNQL